MRISRNTYLYVILMAAAMAAFWPSSCPAGEQAAVVKVARANIRSGPGTGYPVVHTMEQGDRLKLLEQQGDWYRIALPREGHGWIYKELISIETSDAARKTAGSLFDSLKKGFVSSRSEEVTAAAGSRGLGEEEGKSGMPADYEAVGRMEKSALNPDRVRSFVREGGLTPEEMP